MKNEFDYLNDVKMDFSCYESEIISEKEINNMGKNMNKLRGTANFKKIIATAACVAVFTVTTAFAVGVVGNIIKTVKTGYNSFHQIDYTAGQPLMEELKGKIFDENGNMLESISASDFDNIYDKEGNKITGDMFAKMIEEATGGLVEIYGNYDAKDREVDFENLKLAEENAVFDIKTPEYLPEDYTLDRVYTYKNEDGTPSSEYITLVYKNAESKEITFFERILNEETAFEAGTDGSLEELTVNGRIAALTNDSSLSYETEDNISVTIRTYGNVSKAELVKIAESVK